MIALIAVLALLALAPATAWGHDRPAYWGAHIGDHLTGAEAPWDPGAADAFESAVGKRMSLLEFSLPWATCWSGPCDFLDFPTTAMDSIRDGGAIPVFSWASYSQPVSSDQAAFRLSRIAAGAHDDYIRRWAAGARRWGHPFFLRFNWEMNLGGLWPYSEYRNGNRRGDFVRAWRHVHRVVRRAGADNVTWVWCPNVEYGDSVKPLRRLYPGDRFVDWTCLDGYNWGPPPAGAGWTSFHDLFGPTYRLIARRIAPRKPLMIAETASTENGGSKAAWIRGMFDRLGRGYRRVRALLWFEKYDSGMDWPLASSAAARAAFGDGIASRRFIPGAVRPDDAPIRPPRCLHHGARRGRAAHAATRRSSCRSAPRAPRQAYADR